MMTRPLSRDSAEVAADIIRTLIGVLAGAAFIAAICVWWMLT